jgi:hypothetical protein
VQNNNMDEAAGDLEGSNEILPSSHNLGKTSNVYGLKQAFDKIST